MALCNDLQVYSLYVSELLHDMKTETFVSLGCLLEPADDLLKLVDAVGPWVTF